MTILATQRARLLTSHGQATLAARLLELVEQATPSLRARPSAVLCHNDLHFHNVIAAIQRGQLQVRGVIDYESAIFAFPEYDLAKCLVVCSAFTDADQALRAGYRHHVDDTLLTNLLSYHAIDGWLWAALIEQRDQHLWQSRLDATTTPRQRPP